MAPKTIPILILLISVVFAPRVWSASGRHNPDTFACSSTPFAYDAFEHRPSVPSPDGKARIQLEPESTFRVLVEDKEIGKLTYPDISCCVEVGWSPDTSRFFISYSDGGVAGGYHVHVFSIRDFHLVESAAPKVAFENFKEQHYCQTRGNNIFFLDFTSDSRDGFLVTEVYPTSDCGREMGKFRGYLVNLDTGKILEKYGEKQTTAIEKSCRAAGKLKVLAAQRSHVAPPDIKLPPDKAPKFFPEPLVIQGTVLAYRWSSHKMLAFEGIYTDIMVVRVNKVLKGDAPGKYLRVDFWGNVYPHLNLQLPDAMFTGQSAWQMVLNVPSAVFPRQPELCRSLSKDTVTMLYEDTGKREEVSAFRNTGNNSEPFPPARDLPCFVVETTGVSPVR